MTQPAGGTSSGWNAMICPSCGEGGLVEVVIEDTSELVESGALFGPQDTARVKPRDELVTVTHASGKKCEKRMKEGEFAAFMSPKK